MADIAADDPSLPPWPPPFLLLTVCQDPGDHLNFADTETGSPDIFRRVDACIADPSGYWFLVSL
jgi:hypothetical protein